LAYLNVVRSSIQILSAFQLLNPLHAIGDFARHYLRDYWCTIAAWSCGRHTRWHWQDDETRTALLMSWDVSKGWQHVCRYEPRVSAVPTIIAICIRAVKARIRGMSNLKVSGWSHSNALIYRRPSSCWAIDLVCRTRVQGLKCRQRVSVCLGRRNPPVHRVEASRRRGKQDAHGVSSRQSLIRLRTTIGGVCMSSHCHLRTPIIGRFERIVWLHACSIIVVAAVDADARRGRRSTPVYIAGWACIRRRGLRRGGSGGR
jgi:hypothetical protein